LTGSLFQQDLVFFGIEEALGGVAWTIGHDFKMVLRKAGGLVQCIFSSE
jgi:hypothetical protein